MALTAEEARKITAEANILKDNDWIVKDCTEKIKQAAILGRETIDYEGSETSLQQLAKYLGQKGYKVGNIYEYLDMDDYRITYLPISWAA